MEMSLPSLQEGPGSEPSEGRLREAESYSLTTGQMLLNSPSDCCPSSVIAGSSSGGGGRGEMRGEMSSGDCDSVKAKYSSSLSNLMKTQLDFLDWDSLSSYDSSI